MQRRAFLTRGGLGLSATLLHPLRLNADTTIHATESVAAVERLAQLMAQLRSDGKAAPAAATANTEEEPA